VQFHPTGLMAGPDTRMTGTVLEEGLRGAGAHLLGGDGRRFMAERDARAERATRDVVSRAMFEEMRKGNTGPRGGLYLTMRHLDPAQVRRQFKGMVERCADCGFDLVGGLVEVVPTAHYLMGGVVVAADCATALSGLFAAGEDAGGVHGANRLGGNGVANSTVFGGIAGEAIAAWAARNDAWPEPDEGSVEAAAARCRAPLARPPGDLEAIRARLLETMWEDAGIVRDAASLARAEAALDAVGRDLARAGVDGGATAYNMAWHEWLDLESLTLASRAICRAALARADSRGAHFRADFPLPSPLEESRFTRVRLDGGRLAVDTAPVRFTRVRPGETLA
jgi:fumarate reductase flavoprotein subunit